jgi:hypothetical protein
VKNLNIPCNLITTDKIKSLAYFVLFGFFIFIFLGSPSFLLATNVSPSLEEDIIKEDDTLPTDQVISDLTEGEEMALSPTPSPESPKITPTPTTIKAIKYEMVYLEPPTILSVKLDGKIIPVRNLTNIKITEFTELYLEGKGEIGAEIYIFFRPKMLFTKTIVDNNGNWKVSVKNNFGPGEYALELKQFKASNASQRSSYSFSVEKEQNDSLAAETNSNNPLFMTAPLFIGTLFSMATLGFTIYQIRQKILKKKISSEG